MSQDENFDPQLKKLLDECFADINSCPNVEIKEDVKEKVIKNNSPVKIEETCLKKPKTQPLNNFTLKTNSISSKTTQSTYQNDQEYDDGSENSDYYNRKHGLGRWKTQYQKFKVQRQRAKQRGNDLDDEDISINTDRSLKRQPQTTNT